MSVKPLEGILVIDLTRVLAGPFCTMVLKDLGAEVIKIESPITGDDSRHFGPFLDKEKSKSAYFMSINCGKKSLSIDLKKEEGKGVLTDLIKKADVLVDNYRPGTLERLGFSDEYIKEINSRIIYASTSGFGHTGPDSNKPAYDMIIQAVSGIMSVTGSENGENVRVGSSISDIVAGMYTAIGITSALYRREKADIGARIDVAMLDSTVSVLENAIARYQVTGEAPIPLGSRHPSITPFDTFLTKDSEIVICAGNDKLFNKLCSILDLEELVHNPKYISNEDRTKNHKKLKGELNNILNSNTTDYWLKKLTEVNIPNAKINNIKDLFENHQIKQRNMLIPVEGEEDFRTAGFPVKFGGEPDLLKKGKVPELGEHNEDVLKSILKYSDARIEMLYNQKVLSKWINKLMN